MRRPALQHARDPVLPYAIQPTECHDVMVVNHYFTKSRADWLAKVRRGKADARDPVAIRTIHACCLMSPARRQSRTSTRCVSCRDCGPCWAVLIRRTADMDKIAIRAIFKDEARYLLEWLAFHRLIGVNSFVLYDNGSTDGGPELIRRSQFAHHVTLIDWPGVGMQIPAYQHFCAYHAAKFDLGGDLYDLDEFIMPVGGNTIREPLTRRAYSVYSSILLQWFVVSAVGTSSPAERAGDRSYTTRLPDNMPSNRHVKPLVRGKAVSTASTYAAHHQRQRTHSRYAWPDRSVLCATAPSSVMTCW